MSSAIKVAAIAAATILGTALIMTRKRTVSISVEIHHDNTKPEEIQQMIADFKKNCGIKEE